MADSDIQILSAHEVRAVLTGREVELIRVVQMAYEIHAQGASSLPPSTFLHFSNDKRNRIIALPAYLGQDFEVAGVKWMISIMCAVLKHQCIEPNNRCIAEASSAARLPILRGVWLRHAPTRIGSSYSVHSDWGYLTWRSVSLRLISHVQTIKV